MYFAQMHHLAINCSDYQKAKTFYVDLLGLTVIREHHRPERNDWKIDLRFGAYEIELFINPELPTRPSYPEALGLRHLAFYVPEIEPAIAYLAAHGVACEPVREDQFTGKKMTFFFDPDGLPLELHE